MVYFGWPKEVEMELDVLTDNTALILVDDSSLNSVTMPLTAIAGVGQPTKIRALWTTWLRDCRIFSRSFS